VPHEAAVKNKTILLIDDVLTTGATASEAASALKRAGAKTVYVLTLAH
jgi:predicted amidophosphoribosyltransferase